MKPTIFLVLALLPVSAGAQDFFGAGVGAKTAANAGIYLPSSDNALDALAVNPAGLSALRSPVVNLSAVGLLATGSFRNAVNPNSPMRTTAGATPYGAFGLPVSRRVTLAAGFLPDMVSSAKWQYRDSLYGAQHETSRISAFRATAGIAYEVTSKVSIGATVSAIHNANTLIMPYVFQTHPVLSGLKTALDLHTSGMGWNTSFGFTVRPTRRWELGGMYRTSSAITSTGTANGNMGLQFAAAGIPFRPDFAYRAQVKVELPQSALFSMSWQATPALRLSAQGNWTNWKQSFRTLPVNLTQGTNADINKFLASTSIADEIPLHWKDQFSFRAAAQRSLGESFSVAGGFVHQSNPVPSSTLSPLTAAIMSNGITAGGGYGRGRSRIDLAYQINVPHQQTVGISSLHSTEFSNSTLRVGTQALILSTSFKL